jgi:hypothetical protein
MADINAEVAQLIVVLRECGVDVGSNSNWLYLEAAHGIK